MKTEAGKFNEEGLNEGYSIIENERISSAAPPDDTLINNTSVGLRKHPWDTCEVIYAFIKNEKIEILDIEITKYTITTY